MRMYALTIRSPSLLFVVLVREELLRFVDELAGGLLRLLHRGTRLLGDGSRHLLGLLDDGTGLLGDGAGDLLRLVDERGHRLVAGSPVGASAGLAVLLAHRVYLPWLPARGPTN